MCLLQASLLWFVYFPVVTVFPFLPVGKDRSTSSSLLRCVSLTQVNVFWSYVTVDPEHRIPDVRYLVVARRHYSNGVVVLASTGPDVVPEASVLWYEVPEGTFLVVGEFVFSVMGSSELE